MRCVPLLAGAEKNLAPRQQIGKLAPMLGTKAARHPTDDQLFDYCHSRLDEVEGSLIARHLEQCPVCARKMEQGRRMLTLLGGFSPAAYGASYHRDVLRRALLAATRRAAGAAQRRRLAEWARREPEFAGLVLQWWPAEAPADARLKLVRTFTGSSFWHLQAGPKPGKPLNTVEPHGSAWPADRDRIGVLIRHWPEGRPGPLVLFAWENDPARVEVGAPRRAATLRAKVTSFRAASAGRFLLGFEPAPDLRDHP